MFKRVDRILYCLAAIGVIGVAALVADVMITLEAVGTFWGG